MMRCEECQTLIEEFVDLELEGKVANDVADHLAGCIQCTTVVRELRLEQETYAQYQPDIQVSPTLWAGIQQRLASERSASEIVQRESFWRRFTSTFAVPRISGWATAALVLLAIAATVFVMKYAQNDEPAQTVVINTVPENKPAAPTVTPVNIVGPEATAPNLEVSPPRIAGSPKPPKRQYQVAAIRNTEPRPQATDTQRQKSPAQLVHEAEQRYLAAIAMLSRTADSRRSRIDAATRARLDQAIASIDRTIAGTRRAVRQHPNDPMAVQYMLSAYARKVDVLREINGQ